MVTAKIFRCTKYCAEQYAGITINQYFADEETKTQRS